MSHLAKLGIPLAIGLLAACLNWVTIQTKITPRQYVMVNERVKRGSFFSASALEPTSVGGDAERLSQTLIPWEDHSILLRRTAASDLNKGDLCVYRDLNPIEFTLAKDERAIQIELEDTDPEWIFAGQWLAFYLIPADAPEASPEWIGPFRVLAVGEDVTPEGSGARGRSGVSNRIMLALRTRPGTRDLDEESNRLVLASKNEGPERILKPVLNATPRK